MENGDAISALRALADGTRLQVARLLVEGAFNVGEIQDALGLGQSTVSHHLKVLADAGLVRCRREGRLSWYSWHEGLTPVQGALRSFVQAHAQTLDPEVRRRLARVFESRTERTRHFFGGATENLTPPEGTRPPAAAVDVVARMMALLPKGHVGVDLGTGGGRLLGHLRARASRVIGVDQSPRMLQGANRLASERGWTDVELRLGTLEHLPLADGEADVAIAHQVLHHVGRPELAIGEAHRALRAGGVMALADYLPHDREWMRDEYADLWLGFEPANVVRLLEDAGFSEVVVERHAGSGDELGMFVATGRRGPVVPAQEENHTRSGSRPRRAGRKMPRASRKPRRRTAAHGENG